MRGRTKEGKQEGQSPEGEDTVHPRPKAKTTRKDPVLSDSEAERATHPGELEMVPNALLFESALDVQARHDELGIGFNRDDLVQRNTPLATPRAIPSTAAETSKVSESSSAVYNGHPSSQPCRVRKEPGSEKRASKNTCRVRKREPVVNGKDLENGEGLKNGEGHEIGKGLANGKDKRASKNGGRVHKRQPVENGEGPSDSIASRTKRRRVQNNEKGGGGQ